MHSSAPEPASREGSLPFLVRWLAENPGSWPIPLLAFMVWRQDQHMTALIQQLAALNEALRLLERLPR